MKAQHPYHHIPFDPAKVDKQRWPNSGAAGHEAFDERRYSGVMSCVLEAKTPLAIRKIWKWDQAPHIPGSSLKGLIRTTAQMLGSGCADRFAFKGEEGRINLAAKLAPCSETAACLVCRVFGYAPEGKEFGWAGKVRFHDSSSPEGWNSKSWVGEHLPAGNARLHRKDCLHDSFYYAPPGVGARKKDPLGWKVYLHSKSLSPTKEEFDPDLIVRAGTRFAFRVGFENLTAEEFWVFHFALTLSHRCEQHSEVIDLCHKLGFGKALGLGSSKITIDQIEALNNRRYFSEPAKEFEIPACELDPYLRSGPVRAMRTNLDFGNAAGCVRFPDQAWFNANAGAPIDVWEAKLAAEGPSDYPPREPRRRERRAHDAGEARLPPPPPPPQPTGEFPAHAEVEITGAKGKGKFEWRGETYRCDLIGPMIGKHVGDKVQVLVTKGSVNTKDKRFSGRMVG